MLLCSVSPTKRNVLLHVLCTCYMAWSFGGKRFQKELWFLLIITFFAILKLNYFLKLGPIFEGTSPYEFMIYNDLLLWQSFYKIQKKNSMTELVNNVPLLLYFSASTYHYICVWFWGGQCPTSLISPKVVLLSSICTFVFCPFPARQIKRNVEIEEAAPIDF